MGLKGRPSSGGREILAQGKEENFRRNKFPMSKEASGAVWYQEVGADVPALEQRDGELAVLPGRLLFRRPVALA